MAANKVIIGIPNKGDIKVETKMSLISVLGAATHDTIVLAQQGPALDFNRNWICWKALEQSATHVCFIDTDMTFPSDTINKLLALGKPVVGVASRKKILPRIYTIEVDAPTGARNATADELPGEPFNQIGEYQILVGTGIMLIDLKTVNDWVPKPWFKLDAFWDEGEEPGYTGEDIYFCRKAWKYGLEVWCDPTIKVGHIGDFTY